MTNAIAPNVPTEVLHRLMEHRAQFLAFIQRRVESREMAEDILQAAFVRAVEHGGELREDESAIAWFYRVLRNAVIDHYRHQAVKNRALEAWASEMQTQTEPDTLTKNTICCCIQHVMDDLKPEYRQAIQAVELEENSLHEFAQNAGISDGNAAVRVHRARLALRKQVMLTCGACGDHGCIDCTCKADSYRPSTALQ